MDVDDLGRVDDEGGEVVCVDVNRNEGLLVKRVETERKKTEGQEH